jgi:hypothetical protein
MYYQKSDFSTKIGTFLLNFVVFYEIFESFSGNYLQVTMFSIDSRQPGYG